MIQAEVELANCELAIHHCLHFHELTMKDVLNFEDLQELSTNLFVRNSIHLN